MNTLVVTTDLFPKDPEGDLDLCNGQPGSAFAQWLKDGLLEKGHNCDALIQEDYGWGFWVGKDGLTVWVAVSYAGPPNQEDDSKSEWFLSTNFEIPFLIFRPSYWFKTTPGKELEAEVYRSLKEAVKREPKIEVVREE